MIVALLTVFNTLKLRNSSISSSLNISRALSMTSNAADSRNCEIQFLHLEW